MVPLFADRQGDGKTIARGWKRARRELSVRTGRILQVIEIEHQFAGLIDSVIGKAGVQESAGRIGRFRAGGVAQDEKEFWIIGIFEDWFEAKSLALQSEFGNAGNRQGIALTDE